MNHEYWFLSRAAGLTAYLLLAVAVILGMLIGARVAERYVHRNVLFDLHRFVSVLALVATLFHVYVLLGDGYFNFSVWQLSVPFVSPYRGWQTAAGVAALYLLTVIVVSFYVRQWIGYRTWRAIHFATFTLFAAATLHGITAGTDSGQRWVQMLYGASVVVLAGAALLRAVDRLGARISTRASRIALVPAGAVLVAAFALLPAAGERGRATADADALAASSATPETPSSGAAFPFLPRFVDDVQGTYSSSTAGDTTHLSLQADATGDLPVRMTVELVTRMSVPAPDDESRESSADDEDAEARPVSQVLTNRFHLVDPRGDAVLCEGALTMLNGGTLRGSCNGAGPYASTQIAIAGRLEARRDGTFSGTISGTMQRS